MIVAELVERWARSRWWLLVSMILPVAITVVGVLLLAWQLASQQGEIRRLRGELSTCQQKAP